MIPRILFTASAAVFCLGAGHSFADPAGTAPKTPKEKISYSIGIQIGQGLKRQGVDVDAAALSTALGDALSGATPRMTEDDMRQTLTAFGAEMQARQQAAARAGASKGHQEGDAFLAKNKTQPGVKTLPDGLQYQVITEGTGATPKATDTVKTNYRGTLIDGTEFDSSYKRGQPAEFPVDGVIKGWTEALQMMKVGSKWKLFIPAELAYGDRQAPGGTIPPGSTLIFELELLGVTGK